MIMPELARLPPTIQARLDISKWRSFLLRIEIFLLNLPGKGVNSGFIFMEITGTEGMIGEREKAKETEREKGKADELLSLCPLCSTKTFKLHKCCIWGKLNWIYVAQALNANCDWHLRGWHFFP